MKKRIIITACIFFGFLYSIFAFPLTKEKWQMISKNNNLEKIYTLPFGVCILKYKENGKLTVIFN
jgi:hypothetical protein